MDVDTKILKQTSRALYDFITKYKAKKAANGLSLSDLELVVGVGIAADWLRWASSLEELSFSKRAEKHSRRVDGMAELTRFNFLWTATNAIFARPAILELLLPAGTNIDSMSELKRFRVLVNSAQLNAADVKTWSDNLHKILGSEIQTKSFPWLPAGRTTLMWDVIHHKYTVKKQQSLGVGKEISKAVHSRNFTSLDFPAIIYATRNWNVHGALISSSFRSTPAKFLIYIQTINNSLGQVLHGTSKALLATI
jgi:hypothetical protein